MIGAPSVSSQIGSRPAGARGEETPLATTLRRARQAQAAGHVAQAKMLYLDAIQIARQSGDAGHQEANILIQMASVSEPEEAIEGIKRAVTLDEKALGPNNAAVARDLSSLALFCQPQEGCADAEKYHQQALEIAEKLPPKDCWARISVLHNAADFYRRQKNYPEAEKLLREAIEVVDSSPVRHQPDVMGVRSSLASLYQEEGRFDEAEEFLRSDVPSGKDRNISRSNLDVSRAVNEEKPAQQCQEQGKLDEAEVHYKSALAVFEKADRRDAPGLVSMDLNLLGQLHRLQGRDSEAEQCFLRSLEIREKAAAGRAELARLLGYDFELLNLYRDQGRLSEMEPIYQRAVAIQEATLDPLDNEVSNTLMALARVYGEEHKYDDAVPVYQRGLHIKETNLGLNSPNLAFFLDEYAGLLQKSGRADEAASARASAEQIRNRKAEGKR